MKQGKKNDIRPRSRKTARDTVVTTVKKEGTPRKVSITLRKGQLEPGEVMSYVGVSVQTALMELGVDIDITIRETEDAYEVIAEE